MINVLKASIKLTLESLDDIELSTLCNLSTANFTPSKKHYRFDKWIALFGQGRTKLDQDVIDLILDEVSRRSEIMKYSQ